MLRRLLFAIHSRLHQVNQISSWRRRKLSIKETDDCRAIRNICTCLFAVTEAAIEQLQPQETGTLFSVLRKCVIVLAVFMGGNPINTETNALVMDLKQYVQTRCPNLDICTMALTELTSVTLMAMQLEYNAEPEFAAALADLNNPNCTNAQMHNASMMISKITTRFSLAVFHQSLPRLRAGYSFREMVAFTSGYRREEDAADGNVIPLPGDVPVEYNVDDTEAEYDAVGERVSLTAFCEPVTLVSYDVQCSVCMNALGGPAEQDLDQQVMVAKCGHTFHKLCLDKWVNDSGMKASNTCPSCRRILCEPRERQHASVQDNSMTGAIEEDDTAVSDGSNIESFGPMPPRPRVHWLDNRIAAHLTLGADDLEDDTSSKSDGLSNATSEMREARPLGKIFDVLRAERVLRSRAVNY